jgi:hypothetical protein
MFDDNYWFYLVKILVCAECLLSKILNIHFILVIVQNTENENKYVLLWLNWMFNESNLCKCSVHISKCNGRL